MIGNTSRGTIGAGTGGAALLLAALLAIPAAAQQDAPNRRQANPPAIIGPADTPAPPVQLETAPIPPPPTMPGHEPPSASPEFEFLHVAALYNDEEIQLRYRYETDTPSWYHGVRTYRDGEWTSPEDGFQEDRISVMIDDGSVPGFPLYGGYLTAHRGVRSLPEEPSQEEVSESFIAEWGLGDDVRKFLALSRELPEDASREELWRYPVHPTAIDTLREEGKFISTIQWRAHRSAPIGYGDPGYILVYRSTAEGTGPYADNWDEENNRPLYMFDPDVTGHAALNLDTLREQGYGLDDHYYLAGEHMAPFDPGHEWEEDDTLPAYYLREPAGSRGAVRSTSRYADGAWHVTMTRALEAPNPLDSKTFEHGGVYNVQFAVHRAIGERHHDVSMPLQLSLGAGADAHLKAVYTEGPLEDAAADYTAVPIFSPGILTYAEASEQGGRAYPLLRLAASNPLNPARLQPLRAFLERHEAGRIRGAP